VSFLEIKQKEEKIDFRDRAFLRFASPQTLWTVVTHGGSAINQVGKGPA